MLIRPIPFTDEIDRGYLGRVMRLNGKRDQKEILELIATWLGSTEKTRRELPILEMLSKVASINLSRFVCQHTTLPLRRAITSYLPDLPHGDESNRSMLRISGMRLIHSDACFCRECVQKEQETLGVSYWHRKLQIPGLLWCPEHGAPLAYVEDEKAFLSPPSHFFRSASTVDAIWSSAFQVNDAIQRFISIAFGLMDRETPLHTKRVAQVLKHRAVEKKLIDHEVKRKDPLLSDVILDTFNTQWLRITLPSISKKQRGITFRQLDTLFSSQNFPPPVTVYILSLAALFETAEAALTAMTMNDEDTLRQATNHSKEPGRRDIDAYDSYAHTSKERAELGTDAKQKTCSTPSRLNSLALSNLTDPGGIVQDFITSFLVEGKSLDESKATSGIDEQEMQHVLREMAARALN